MINLLPFFYKEELEKDDIYKIVLNFAFIFCFFSTTLILTFLLIYFQLKAKLDVLQIEVSTQEKMRGDSLQNDLKNKMSDISKTIAEIISFYNKQIYSTSILEKVFNSLPEGVRLTSFSWQKESGNVIISGFAPTRKTLFELKNNLELVPEFSEIEFPPQNWIKGTDIEFQTTFKIKHQ